MSRLALALLVLCMVGLQLEEGLAAPANIVLILADDLGREALGCYGGESYRTPRLDALARGGMRFQHAYVMPVCHPTRLALLTGRYPSRFRGASWGTFPKDAEAETLAWSLKRVGYRTAVAGKWQLALLGQDLEHPHRLGFDEYSLFGWHEGPRYYRPWIWQNGKKRADVADKYGPDVYCDFLVDFIDRGKESGKPFFAFFSMALAHDVTDDLEAPVPFAPAKDRYDSYAEMVESLDRVVGKLIDALETRRLTKETLLIFVADNGSPGRSISGVENGKLKRAKVLSRWNGRVVPGGKGSLSDLGIRVPMIASRPGSIAAGQVTSELVDVTDFLPSLVEVAQARAPQGVQLDGRSFVSILGGDRGRRDWIFAERGRTTCVRSKGWKLHSDGRLFDMIADPNEKRPSRPGGEGPRARAARERLESAFKVLPIPRRRP